MVENLSSDEFINFVNKLLDETGEIALKNFRNKWSLSLKGDDSPVTNADREIEKVIRLGIQNKFPTHSIVGEELEDLKNISTFKWFIDPIDGTRSYIAGKRDFGTLIRLMEGDRLIGGVIDCPALG